MSDLPIGIFIAELRALRSEYAETYVTLGAIKSRDQRRVLAQRAEFITKLSEMLLRAVIAFEDIEKILVVLDERAPGMALPPRRPHLTVIEGGAP